MRPVVGVEAHIAQSGQIELLLPSGGKRVHGDAGCTAMWVSLQICDGDVDAAATLLAGIWEEDSLTVWGAMILWFTELEDAGILSFD